MIAHNYSNVRPSFKSFGKHRAIPEPKAKPTQEDCNMYLKGIN